MITASVALMVIRGKRRINISFFIVFSSLYKYPIIFPKGFGDGRILTDSVFLPGYHT
jgi:hypothetical protein